MAETAEARRCDGVMDRIAWFSQPLHSVVEDCAGKWLALCNAVKIKTRCVGLTAFFGGSGVVVLWRSLGSRAGSQALRFLGIG